ncbi:hypothetical protein [Bradyrhizobium sp. NP1]|uniref:hypothetical protein n=1 Tax=Bradyrhizobium sp. NP1 TaxID=3049772 RepID=UPI0025A616C7|nr:hypothetical protein [Bradyrhizobium sp. NP1]WJR74921.1 hypothetical protein QOU61_19020 [Bradyrhizobium sp. NP1]
MAKVIEAVARISAEDKTGAVFDKIAKKIEGIAKSAKSSAEVDKLSKALARAQQQMAAIDRFGSAKGGFADARTKFREAQVAVDRAARAMKAGQGDAAALARAYETAQAAVSRASAAFERQKVAVMQAKHGLEQLGIPANRAAAAQDKLRAAVERTNAALEKQPGKLARAANAVGRGIGNVLPFAGPAILHGTKEAAKAGAEVQSEVVKMRAAGVPEADIRRAMGESGDLTAKYTNVKRADALERFKELRSIMLHPEEAHELLPLAVQATSAMNAVDRTGELAKGLNFGFRGAEILGLGQDPARMRAYIDSFIKAQQVMGKTITPEMQYEFAKYAKASGATLSDRFKMTTGVSLSQELGGQTTGQSIDQFVKQITGGFQGNNHSAAKEFVAMGMVPQDYFETTKTGEIKGMKPGKKMPGWQVAQSDPDKYVYDYLLPAFQKHGINSQDEQIAQIRRMFPAGRAADLVTKLVQQRESFTNHAKLYGEAQGLNATEGNQKDPFVALNSLTTSLSNFAGALTSPAMENAAGVMSSMASWFGTLGNSLSKFNEDHPDFAKVAGGAALAGGFAGGSVLTWNLASGLLTGFGLPSASVQLSGSAAALSAAAAELSAAAGVGAAAKGATVATAAGGAGIWAAGAAALPWVAAGAGVAGGLYAMHKQVEDAGYDGLTSGERLRRQRGSMRDVYRRAFGYDELSGPELSPTMTYGTGVGGDKQVTAQLTGSADVHGEAKITVEASSTLLQIARDAQNAIRLVGTLNANGPGSLGHSSPDAIAPAPRPSLGPQAPISY